MTSSKYKSAGPFGLSAVLTAAGLALALAGQAAGQPVAQPQAGQPDAGQVQPAQPQPVNQPPAVPSAAAGAVAPAASPTAVAAPASGTGLPPQPPPAQKRGFLNDFGKWWDESIANFNAKMKEQQDKIDESNKKSSEAMKEAAAATQQAMKNAADAMAHLGTSKMIEVHEICAIAGNGAPDCQAAATNACRGKGFGGGQPLDIRTAEKCNASLWVSGQAPAPGNCPVETVVLRAACQ